VTDLYGGGAQPDDYVELTPALSAVIDLHGARARRRHVAVAVMRTLGYVPSAQPSDETLLAFAWLGGEIAELLALGSVPIEAKARALSSRIATIEDPLPIEVDLDLSPRVEGDRTLDRARRVVIGDDLFPRLRRLLRRLADDGTLVDLG
jgi:hypothetical protein